MSRSKADKQVIKDEQEAEAVHQAGVERRKAQQAADDAYKAACDEADAERASNTFWEQFKRFVGW